MNKFDESKVNSVIRDVKQSDAAEIAKIYNHYIKHSVITFEQNSVSISEMESRISEVAQKFPWIVIEVDNEIKGYAYANTWKVRESYRYSVEASIYFSKSAQGQGLGSALYTELLLQLERMNIHAVVGGIALPNSASIRLHEKLGFEKIGEFKEIGYKHDHWVNVGYWQKIFHNNEAKK